MIRRAALLLPLLAAPAAAQEELRGTWRGGYVCAQGHTAMTLTIEPDKGKGVTALFHFEAARDNPEVPTGCYEMRGHFDPGSRRVVLSGHRWILRPPHYVMVGLSGQLSEAGDRIAGRVSGPSCTSFEVERAPGHADPGACRRGGPLLSLR